MNEKVIALIAKQLNLPKDKVKENSKIIEDLGADSLDVVEMLMALEEEFKITLSDEQAAKLKTVKDIVDVITSSKK